MSQVEEFVGEVRAKDEKYYDIQIPRPVAKLLDLKKGTLVRIKISVA